MKRIARIGLLACLSVAALDPALAARKGIKVPDQFDGHWSIEATTLDGPCSRTNHYDVQITNGDASYSGGDVDIDGTVAPGGTVQATIVKGSIKVPISGSLDPRGTGSGTWHSTGDSLFACSGIWSAKRAS